MKIQVKFFREFKITNRLTKESKEDTGNVGKINQTAYENTSEVFQKGQNNKPPYKGIKRKHRESVKDKPNRVWKYMRRSQGKATITKLSLTKESIET